MTLDTRKRGGLRSLRHLLDDIRVDSDATGNLFVRAVDNFLTAAGYQDQALMRAAVKEAKAALEVSVPVSIEDRVTLSAAALDHFRRFTAELDGAVIEPDEGFDDIGRSASKIVNTALGGLRDLRDGLVATVRKHGVEVPNAAKLDEHIAHWEAVKMNLVDCWPWTTSTELPPVDREMVARSRAAFQAGDRGEDIDALIERLRSE